jgi:hypothetical protein
VGVVNGAGVWVGVYGGVRVGVGVLVLLGAAPAGSVPVISTLISVPLRSSMTGSSGNLLRYFRIAFIYYILKAGGNPGEV